MLFTYRYVDHPVDRLQRCIKHLVRDVWCRAHGRYSSRLLHKTLRIIIDGLKADSQIRNDYLAGPIRDIDRLFRSIPPKQRRIIAAWYDANNDVENLCCNDGGTSPGTYKDISNINPKLAAKLRAFFY